MLNRSHDSNPNPNPSPALILALALTTTLAGNCGCNMGLLHGIGFACLDYYTPDAVGIEWAAYFSPMWCQGEMHQPYP